MYDKSVCKHTHIFNFRTQEVHISTTVILNIGAIGVLAEVVAAALEDGLKSIKSILVNNASTNTVRHDFLHLWRKESCSPLTAHLINIYFHLKLFLRTPMKLQDTPLLLLVL